MKRAIINCQDTGPLQSLVHMLNSVGYDCYTPSAALRDMLRRVGCTNVDEPKDMVGRWGYEPHGIPETDSVVGNDIIVDIKAHENYGKLVQHIPSLVGHILWYCINGGDPSKRDSLLWSQPPCPVITPNRWYADEYYSCNRCEGKGYFPGIFADKYELQSGDGEKCCWECNGDGERATLWYNTPRYVFWPPFVKFDDYYVHYFNSRSIRDPPICLVHNVMGWGYGDIVNDVCGLGVRCYGGNAPHGLLPYKEVPIKLANALAYVHVKAGDCCSYSVMEALAAACPVVCTQQYIDDTKMGDLLEPNITCMVFDGVRDLKSVLSALTDPDCNEDVGQTGRYRLAKLMWSDDRDRDSLREFMKRNFE